MSTLDTNARKLVATSGANFWHPAVTDEELTNDQLLIDSYRRAMGAKRIAYGILGVFVGSMIWNYVRNGE